MNGGEQACTPLVHFGSFSIKLNKELSYSLKTSVLIFAYYIYIYALSSERDNNGEYTNPRPRLEVAWFVDI